MSELTKPRAAAGIWCIYLTEGTARRNWIALRNGKNELQSTVRYIFQYLPGTSEERIKPWSEETAVVENLARFLPNLRYSPIEFRLLGKHMQLISSVLTCFLVCLHQSTFSRVVLSVIHPSARFISRSIQLICVKFGCEGNFVCCHITILRGRDTAVGIATCYGRGVGVWVPVRVRFFPSPRLPDRFCGPPYLLSNGYRGSFPGGKAAEVKNTWIYTSTLPHVFMA
jgi:hypothetical protein